MIRASKFNLLLAGAALVTVSACTEAPGDNTRQGAMAGALLGAATGALVSDGNKARGAVRGALIGAGVGSAIGYNLDRQEAELRRDLGNGATIVNTGDRLIVSMPQDILFATNSAALQPAVRNDLRTVAQSLRSYPGSTVQVLGHTDNTGSATLNYDLSQRRAGAVASELIAGGVEGSRLQTIGRGEDQPIASNLTPEGRARNRRVEIVILPNA